ncbi:hypothetical protein [Telmatospirillum sp. J64-1]|uniref:hypothetical protein n=1 Tax=Telmatospirillum sp. J64-1 TaxID=2502183 RepID=UPI00115D8839|nr:hypothetical protein [Telmatospirillum sp. J64-1]
MEDTPFMPDDVMSQRAEMVSRLAFQLDRTVDPVARQLLVKTMANLIITITPKTGELVVFPGGRSNDDAAD